MKNKIVALVIVLMLASLLSACGDGETLPVVGITPTTLPGPTIASSPSVPLSQKWQYKPGQPKIYTRPLQLSPDRKTAYQINFNGSDSAEIVAIGLTNGQPLWSYDIKAAFANGFELPQTSSYADSDTLYVSPYQNNDGYLVALDAAKGSKKWEFKAAAGQSAFSQPLGAIGDKLIVTMETPADQNYNIDTIRTSYIIGLDKKTGAESWRFKADNTALVQQKFGSNPRSTATIITPEVLYVKASDGNFYALEPSTGKTRWKLEATRGTLLALANSYKDGALFITRDNLQLTWGLRAVAAKDGATLWDLPIPIDKQEAVIGGQFLTDNTHLMLYSSVDGVKNTKVYSIDVTKPAIQWSITDQRIYQDNRGLSNSLFKGGPGQLVALGIITKQGLVAIDSNTGKTTWERNGTNAGLVVTKDLVFTTENGKLLALDVKDGAEKWSTTLPIPRVLSSGLDSTDDLVLVYALEGITAYGKAG